MLFKKDNIRRVKNRLVFYKIIDDKKGANMGLINKVKENRNIIGLTGVCLINNILYMFVNTFMVAYFITLTNYDYRLISIYYALSFVGILLTFLACAKTIKNKSQVIILRSGIILYCVYILLLALLKDKIITYYASLGFFYGIVQGLFWVAGHTLINEYTKNVENAFISIKSILSKILKIFFPIIFGVSIQLTSFSYVAKIVLILSLIQFSFSLLIRDKEQISKKEYDLKEFIRYIKDNKKFKIVYQISMCDGIVHYLLETLITILIVMTFKTTISLGVLTTVFSICSMISVYIFQYKLKSNKNVLKTSYIFMIISVVLLLFNINKISIIIYNLCNSVFLVLLMNTAETKSYSIVNEDKKVIDDYIVEHQIIYQIALNIARISAYIVLFIVSLFNNMFVFKILLFLVTIVIVIYGRLMITLDKSISSKKI